MVSSITIRSQIVTYYISPIRLIFHLWSHHELVWQFIRREVQGRYKGAFFGLMWALVQPLVLLLIYTFIFGVVLKPSWQGQRSEGLGDVASIIFCGLIAFNIFSECVSRAATLVIEVPNYVKKVVFPIEVLPVSLLGSALFHALVSLAILLTVRVFTQGTVHWTLLLLPLVALPLVFLSMALAWFLAGLGVFIRDVHYAVGLLIQVLFFSTPILYSLRVVPEPFHSVIQWNPLTTVVYNFRGAILWGVTPDWTSWASWLVVTGFFMMLGYAWFMKTKPVFADVI